MQTTAPLATDETPDSIAIDWRASCGPATILKLGEYVKHPAHKLEVHITQIDGDMVAFTVTPPVGSGQYRAWANVRSFMQVAA